MKPAPKNPKRILLLRVELDDEILVDVGQDIVPRRWGLEDATEFLVVQLDPVGQADLLGHAHRALNTQLLARLLAHLDDVAGLALIGGDRHRLLIDQDGLVADQLARFGTRSCEAHPVHNVVQTALEQLQQVLTGGTRATGSLGVVVGELTLEHAVHATQLLLLAQLSAVVRQALTALALDAARRHLELALALERLGATLEEKIRAFATSELAGRTRITRHVLNPSLLGRTAAVVRNRRDVGNAGDLQAAVVQRANCGFAAGTRATNTHFHVLHTVFLRGSTGLLGGNLRGEWRALA